MELSTSPQTPEAMPQDAPIREGAPYRTLTVTPVTRAIGAEIEGVDLREPLSHETLGELKKVAGSGAFGSVIGKASDLRTQPP